MLILAPSDAPPTDTTYYVDPNGGSSEDAIEVTCRRMEKFEGWFTCVRPQSDVQVSLRCLNISPVHTSYRNSTVKTAKQIDKTLRVLLLARYLKNLLLCCSFTTLFV